MKLYPFVHRTMMVITLIPLLSFGYAHAKEGHGDRENFEGKSRNRQFNDQRFNEERREGSHEDRYRDRYDPSYHHFYYYNPGGLYIEGDNPVIIPDDQSQYDYQDGYPDDGE